MVRQKVGGGRRPLMCMSLSRVRLATTSVAAEDDEPFAVTEDSDVRVLIEDALIHARSWAWW